MFSGSSTLNQIEKIIDQLGTPSKEEAASMQSTFTESMLDSITVTDAAAEKGLTEQERWRRVYPSPDAASDDAIDLLSQLLKFNPSKRITPRDGMVHPYCAQFHDAETEIEWEGPYIMNEFDDNKKLRTQDYRERLYGRERMRDQK